MGTKDAAVILLVVLGAFVALPVLGMVFMGPAMGPMMGQWMRPGMMGRGAWFGAWWLGLLLAAAVAVIVLLARRPAGDDPLVVLKQRLARGEITKEQYTDLTNTLRQS
jgi:uncharacterized membrane protein